MSCLRCGGHMIDDHLLDSWRCVNCGRVPDSAIEQHRLVQQEKVLTLPSGEPDYQDDEVHIGAESFIRLVA
jgi:hypothetical protein